MQVNMLGTDIKNKKCILIVRIKGLIDELFYQKQQLVNPLSPNSGPSQISHCNIKVLLVREVMRTEHMFKFC